MKVITVASSEYMRAHLFPCHKTPVGRRKKYQASSESQNKHNDKMALHKLSDRVEANFTPDDYMLTLTYDDEHLPADPAGALAKFAAYIKRLKRDMVKAGTDPKTLKYINIIQQGNKGGRLHHHVFISAPGLSYAQIVSRWGQGHTDAKSLQFNEDGIRGLAEYCLEGRATVKRWTCTQNLSEPAVKDYGPFAMSAKDVKHISEHPEDKAYVEKRFPGWKVSRVESDPNSDIRAMFVCIYFYRENNAFFRYGRGGYIDYTYKPRSQHS